MIYELFQVTASMDAVEQSSTLAGDSQSQYYVILLADYSPSDDYRLLRGEKCLVLGHHGDDWVRVSHPELAGPVYLPTLCVQRVNESSRCEGFPNPSGSISRAHTLGPSTRPSINPSWTGVVRSISQRSSQMRSSTSPDTRTGDNDDDNDDDDLPEPPTTLISAILSTSKSPPADSDASLVSSFGDGTRHRDNVSIGEACARQTNDVTNSEHACQLQTTDSSCSVPQQKDAEQVSFLAQVNLLL